MNWVFIPILPKTTSSAIPFPINVFKNYSIIFPSLVDWAEVSDGNWRAGEGWVYEHSPPPP